MSGQRQIPEFKGTPSAQAPNISSGSGELFDIIPTMRVLIPLIFLFMPVVGYAAVNDILPGDYFPLQPGQTTLAVYAFDREFRGPYVAGRKLLDGKISSRVIAIRGARAFQVGDMTLASVAVLPWSNTHVTPAPLAAGIGEQANGFGDLRLGLTGWLINDKANANYLGLSGMVIAPTGEYDARQILNPGENRWRVILYGGWQKDITPNWLIELSPEFAWYGKNDDYFGHRKLEQRASYALTGYSRWRLSPAWHVYAGGQLNRGGETRINGVDQNNPANNKRLMVGMTWFLPEKQQLILRFSRDVANDNGFRSKREITLRLQKVF